MSILDFDPKEFEDALEIGKTNLEEGDTIENQMSISLSTKETKHYLTLTSYHLDSCLFHVSSCSSYSTTSPFVRQKTVRRRLCRISQR
jgi:hypothetical protein